MTSDKQAILAQLEADILSYDQAAVVQTAQQVVDHGIDVMEAIQVASAAVEKIGQQFEQGEVFLPQLMLAGATMKACMGVLTRHLSRAEAAEKKGKAVIGAAFGDIHDIGKNLVATMLAVHGYEVVDLGVNVPAMNFVDAAERENARLIAVSALMTTSMPYQRDVVNLLKEMNVRQKYYVVIGGGPVTPNYARDIGADGWGKDAVAAVRVCDQLIAAGVTPATRELLTE